MAEITACHKTDQLHVPSLLLYIQLLTHVSRFSSQSHKVTNDL